MHSGDFDKRTRSMQAFQILLFGCLLAVNAMAQNANPNNQSNNQSVVQKIAEREAELKKLSGRDPEWLDWNRYLELNEKTNLNRDRALSPEEVEHVRVMGIDAVSMRILKIESLQREIKVLKQPQFAEFLKQGQSLCEDRHRLLATQPIPPTPALRKLGFDPLSFPKIDGSTSTQPLAVMIACRYFDLNSHWSFAPKGNPKEDTGYFDDIELKLAEYSLKPAEKIKSQSRLVGIVDKFLVGNESTHQAYVNILEGTSGFGLLARKPNTEEVELARKLNVELEVVPCAHDAFVFIVAQDGPVTELSTAQIKAIYTGTAKTWEAVGGSRNAKIYPYRRPKNSGSEELMLELVMIETPLSEKVSGNLVGRLMSSVFLNLTQNKDGIAYSVRYYEHYMAGSAGTRTIQVDGVAPTEETIANGTYPYIANVYAVIRREASPDSGPRKLLQWLLTDEGQAVVKQSGYVPLKSAGTPQFKK